MEQLICKNCKKELGEVDKINYDYISAGANSIKIDEAMLVAYLFCTCEFCKSRLVVTVPMGYLGAECSDISSYQEPYKEKVYTLKTKKITFFVDDWDWERYKIELADE